MIQNRFAALLDEKRKRDEKPWRAVHIQRETGVTLQTISRWLQGTVTVAMAKTVIAFCEFLECDVGDLVVYVED